MRALIWSLVTQEMKSINMWQDVGIAEWQKVGKQGRDDSIKQVSIQPLTFFQYLTSGNRTPGSRFYSDLLDTLADSVCIH